MCQSMRLVGGKAESGVGRRGGEVALAELTVLLRADSPMIEMIVPELDEIFGCRACGELIQFAAISVACYFLYSNLKRAENKMVVWLGEMQRKASPAVRVKRVTHEEKEESLLAACRLVPLKSTLFVLAGSGPEVGRLGKGNTGLLIADRGWIIRENTEVSVHAENRENKPE